MTPPEITPGRGITLDTADKSIDAAILAFATEFREAILMGGAVCACARQFQARCALPSRSSASRAALWKLTLANATMFSCRWATAAFSTLPQISSTGAQESSSRGVSWCRSVDSPVAGSLARRTRMASPHGRIEASVPSVRGSQAGRFGTPCAENFTNGK